MLRVFSLISVYFFKQFLCYHRNNNKKRTRNIQANRERGVCATFSFDIFFFHNIWIFASTTVLVLFCFNVHFMLFLLVFGNVSCDSLIYSVCVSDWMCRVGTFYARVLFFLFLFGNWKTAKDSSLICSPCLTLCCDNERSLPCEEHFFLEFFFSFWLQSFSLSENSNRFAFVNADLIEKCIKNEIDFIEFLFFVYV